MSDAYLAMSMGVVADALGEDPKEVEFSEDSVPTGVPAEETTEAAVEVPVEETTEVPVKETTNTPIQEEVKYGGIWEDTPIEPYDRTMVFMLIDRDGPLAFVSTRQKAELFMMTYDNTSVNYIPYKLDPTYPVDNVYAMPYIEVNFPFYVTNNRKLIMEAQSRLISVGKGLPDSIEFWKFTVDYISEEAKLRAGLVDTNKMVDSLANGSEDFLSALVGDVGIDIEKLMREGREQGDSEEVIDERCIDKLKEIFGKMDEAIKGIVPTPEAIARAHSDDQLDSLDTEAAEVPTEEVVEVQAEVPVEATIEVPAEVTTEVPTEVQAETTTEVPTEETPEQEEDKNNGSGRV